MEDMMEYTKVTVSDEAMIAVAKASGFSVKEVVAMENARRYRLAYSKVKQEKDKVMRQWFKQHPELMDGRKA